MVEGFSKYVDALTSPLPTAAVLFMLGLYFITVGFGLTIIKVPWLSLPSNLDRKGKLLCWALGAACVVSSVVLAFSFPVYKPWISKQLIYSGYDAKQIVAYGDDVYLLKDSGNI